MSVLTGIKHSGRSGAPRSGNSRTDHVFGQVVGYELKDPRGMKSDVDDAMIVALYRPALGLSAEQAESGELLTHIKIALKPPQSSGSGYVPLTIADMKKGKGTAKPTNVGDFVQFKDVEKAGEGLYRARRVEGAARNFDSGRHQILCGPVSVFREKEYKDRDGAPFNTQDGVAALTTASVPVATVEELRSAAAGALEYAAQFPETRSFFVLRVLEIENDKVVNAVERTGGLAYVKETNSYLSVEESVDAFLERPNVKDEVVPLLEGAAPGAQLVFEVIPMVGFSIVGSSLPTKRKLAMMEKSKDKERGFSDADAWRWDDSVQFRFRNEENENEPGFADVDLILDRRHDTESNTVSRSYKIFLSKSHPYSGLFSRAELVTDYVKEAFPKVAADLEARAQERAKAKALADKSDNGKDADREPAHDDNAVPGMG